MPKTFQYHGRIQQIHRCLLSFFINRSQNNVDNGKLQS